MSSLTQIKPKIVRTDLAPSAVPDCTPETSVAEYFLSKFEERLEKRKPEWDRPPQTATELVAARRDLQVASKKLAEKWVEGKEKQQQVDKELADLREKEEQLKEAFIHYNTFVKDNKEKQERALKKIQDERRLQEQRSREIEELSEKLKKLEEIKETLETHVNKHKMYEDYLESVVSETKEYSTVFDILNRYETLNTARIELTERQEKDLATLETASTAMAKLAEEKSQLILGLNNQVAELQIRYDRAKAEALRWGSALSNIKNTTAEKALELNQVKTSCWNMYQQICRRKNMPVKLEEGQVEQQLLCIKRTIQGLKHITRIARRRAKKEAASTVANATSHLK
ncbi:coiled-coil domain-containing protein 42 homolog [Periplaneta americana]|uniref:coiled-coil domain-containing protein 42 homolog n=1 Tax=Periplaneta americana TaxID=6978 RepID=UPI0037E98871